MDSLMKLFAFKKASFCVSPEPDGIAKTLLDRLGKRNAAVVRDGLTKILGRRDRATDGSPAVGSADHFSYRAIPLRPLIRRGGQRHSAALPGPDRENPSLPVPAEPGRIARILLDRLGKANAAVVRDGLTSMFRCRSEQDGECK